MPVLDGRASLGALARLWGLVWASNIVGGAAFTAFIATLMPNLGVASPEAFVTIAHKLVDHDLELTKLMDTDPGQRKHSRYPVRSTCVWFHSDAEARASSPRTMAYPPAMKRRPHTRKATSHRITGPGPSGQT